jgi:hypothetical protein
MGCYIRSATATITAGWLVAGCGGLHLDSLRKRSSDGGAAPAATAADEEALEADAAPADCVANPVQHGLTYLEDVLPIANERCVGCHYPSAAAGGWVLDRYGALNPEQLPPAEAWKKAVAAVESGRMPPNSPLPAEQLAVMKNWIAAGAPKQNAPGCAAPEPVTPRSLLACDPSLVPKSSPRIWRLTHTQWGNSTRAILGAAHAEELNFASDPALYGFDNFSDALRITILQTNRYREATQRLANQVLDVTKISALRDIHSPGWGANDPDGDLERFIRSFGFLLFRRPLSDGQIALLKKVHVEGKKSGIGYKLLIEAMLQSPYFLFRRELGADGVLGQYEVAEVLSFTIWDEAPDLTLLRLASEGKLRGATLDEQISRLLGSPKAERLFTRFFGSLLGIGNVKDVAKNKAQFPTFDAEVAGLMYDEFASMIRHVMTNRNAELPALFRDAPSFTNARLAPFHGTTSTSPGLVETSLPNRGSILTSLAFLTANAGPDDNNPFQRGKTIREKLLCLPLSSPPANVPPLTDTPPEGFKTRRERFAAHVSSPSCSGCHTLIDDLGFGLDNFDATGRWQTVAGGLPVDTAGSLTAFLDGPTTFATATEMSSALADSSHLSQCIALQLFRFVRGREDAASDGCQIESAYTKFRGDQMDLRTLVRAMLANDDFYKVEE